MYCHEVNLPRFYLSSPEDSLRTTKSYYSSQTSFFRLNQLFCNRKPLGVQVDHSLMSLGAFSYWTKLFSQWQSGIKLDRESFAEYTALRDLVSNYPMSNVKIRLSLKRLIIVKILQTGY